MKLMV